MYLGNRAWTPASGAALGRNPRSRWQLVQRRLPPAYPGSESGVCSRSASPLLMEAPSGPPGMMVSGRAARAGAAAGGRARAPTESTSRPHARAAARSGMSFLRTIAGGRRRVRVCLPSGGRKGILKLPLVSWSGISNVIAAPDEAHPRPNALSSPPAAPTADTLRLVVRLLACSALSMCLFPEPASASVDCAVVESRSSLSSLSGTVITSVDIVSDGPSLPGPASAFGMLHPVSQTSIIRRQLLFAPGDTVDTLLIGETMRRLRAQRLFADAVILARRCDPSGGVALSVNTRDTWTLRPTARMKSQSQLSFGIEERNLLGSGRSMSLTREMTLRGNGAAFALTDPFVFGQDVSGHFRLSNLAGGHALRLGLLRHDYTGFATWRGRGDFARPPSRVQ